MARRDCIRGVAVRSLLINSWPVHRLCVCSDQLRIYRLRGEPLVGLRSEVAASCAFSDATDGTRSRTKTPSTAGQAASISDANVPITLDLVGQTGGMADQKRAPLADVLPGFTIHPLPEGWTPLEAIVLVKCLDDEGHSSWAFRTTPNLNDEELLGALTVRTDLLRKELLEAYE